MVQRRHTYLHRFGSLVKGIGVFELVVGFFVLLSLLVIMVYTRAKKTWVKAEVKISAPVWWQEYSQAPPLWLGESIQVGDKEYDPAGKPIAEVLEVKSYEFSNADRPEGDARKDFFLTLNLRVAKDRKTNTLKFKSKPLGIGVPIELSLDNTFTSGLVTYIEGIPREEETQEVVVEGVWLDVFPWIAEAIPVGGKMYDGQGQVIAEVLEKKIDLAGMVVTTDTGEVLLKKNPGMRDVTLRLKLLATRQGDNLYFRQDQTVKIGKNLFIHLPSIDIKWVSVMKVFDTSGNRIY